MHSTHIFAALLALCAASPLLGGCNAIVRGGPLSSVPHDNHGVFLTTGDPPAKYQTLGFVQIRGYGVAVAGLTEVGDAQLNGTIRGTLATEAVKMGGTGVIHIEFEDENPQNDAEKAQDAYNSFRRNGSVQTRDRYVTVTGEVVRFTTPLPIQGPPGAGPPPVAPAGPPPVAPAGPPPVAPATPGAPAPPQGTVIAPTH